MNKNINKIYTELLKIPFENISAYYLGKPINYNNIDTLIKENLGGSCFPLSQYANKIFKELNIDNKIIYFELDEWGKKANQTINVKKEIDYKYHNAVIIPQKNKYHLLDLGLKIEKPIKFNKNKKTKFISKTKEIIIERTIKNKYDMHTLREEGRNSTLSFDIDYEPSEKDIERHLINNYYRLVPLKYSILDEQNRKHSLRIRKDNKGFEIKILTIKDTIIKKYDKLNEIANYFNISYAVLNKAYQNWENLHGENYFTDLNIYNPHIETKKVRINHY